MAVELGFSTGMLSQRRSMSSILTNIQNMPQWGALNPSNFPLEMNIAYPDRFIANFPEFAGIINNIKPQNLSVHLPSRIEYPGPTESLFYPALKSFSEALSTKILNFVIHPPFDQDYVLARYGAIAPVCVENMGLNGTNTSFSSPKELEPYVKNGYHLCVDTQHISQLNYGEVDEWLNALSDTMFRDSVKEVHISAIGESNAQHHEVYAINGNYRQLHKLIEITSDLKGKRFIHEGVLPRELSKGIIAAEFALIGGLLPR